MRDMVCNLQRYLVFVAVAGMVAFLPLQAQAAEDEPQGVVITPTMASSPLNAPSQVEKESAPSPSKIPTLAPAPANNKVDLFADPFNPQSVSAAVTVKPSLMKKGYSFEEPVSARRVGSVSRLGSKDIFITESSDTGFTQQATPVRPVSQSGRASR
jgi:hypothetical protein